MEPVEHHNFQQHQQLHRIPDTSQGHFVHGPQDRSAWSHLLSLEPSMTSSVGLSGPLPTSQHLQNTFPVGLLKSSIGFSGSSTKIREHLPMHNFPASSSSSFVQGSHHELPFRGLSQDNVSQHLSQLMNLSKNMASTVKVPLSKPLTVSTEFSSLESSGDYSPVSPPAAPPAYEDPLLDPAGQGKSGKMLDREPPTSALPTAHTQLQGLSGRISSQSGMMGTAVGYTPQRPLDALSQMSFPVLVSNTQKPFASPSDVPLDMTTAVSGKSAFSQVDMVKQSRNFTTPFSTHYDNETVSSEDFALNYKPDGLSFNVPASANPVSDSRETNSHVQTALKSSDSNSGSLNPPTVSAAASFLATPILSQEKSIKLPKSTPKKSNFYGRDASLFSFSNKDAPSTIASSHAFGVSPSSVDCKKDSVNDIPQEEVKSLIDSTQIYEIKNSHLLANVLTENKPLPSEIPPESLKDSVSNPNDLSINDASEMIHPTESLVVPAVDSFIEHVSGKYVPCSDFVTEVSPKVEDQKSVILVPTPSDNMEKEMSLTQNYEHDKEEDIDPDMLKFKTSPNGKTPKGRKRKGPGAGKRTNKQTTKKAKSTSSRQSQPVVPQSVVVLERTNIVSPYEGKVQVDGKEDESRSTVEDAQHYIPGKGGIGKKTRKNIKVHDEEKAPRRSSSRKSKDNAMRLIELQADVGYVSIPGVDEDVLPKRMNRKRIATNSPIKAPHQDEPVLSDLSEDSCSSENQENDKDDDYVVDEEEAAAVEKDEQVDEDRLSNKTFVSKKKPGSLRISIKLSGDSSAEIVSGIEDSPVKKKRKSIKRKNFRNKSKASIIPENVDLKSIPSEENPKEHAIAPPISNSSDLDVQTSLMEKYFSSASASKHSLGVKLETNFVTTGKFIGRKFDQKLNKDLVGRNKKLSVKKNRILPGKDNASPNSSKQYGDTVPKFRCGYCPQRYHTKLDLLTHMDEHMSEMENKDSGKDSTEIKNKNQHRDNNSTQHDLSDRRNEHKSSEEKIPPKDKVSALALQKFKCGECERVFKSKPLLLDHVRCHTADKPFECDICHKCFADRTLLSTHRKTHEQENLLRCQLCSKAFIHKADLTHHMQSHPKRTGSSHSLKSSLSKNVKNVLPKQADSKSQALKKTSFASALSGDVDDCSTNNGVPGVLVLKRKDTALLTTKTKPESVTKNAALGQGTSSTKENLGSAQSSTVNKVIKADPIGINQKKNLDGEKEKTPASQVKDSPKENAPSDVCTCKECPDCVTRFLESFV